MSFALIFPGQGSQSLKILEFWQNENIIIDTFKQASKILDVDFLDMLQSEITDEINLTINTQPLILTMSYAIYKLWQHKTQLDPIVMAGHSLGEWSALVASGAIEFEDALKLVRLRAQYMQNAVEKGSGLMAAVLGLDDAKVIEICNNITGIVAGVNFNSPGQVVIAGENAAVTEAVTICKNAGARKVTILPVSVPSHCNLMLPASENLTKSLANIEFKTPKIPVIHNFDVNSYSEANQIKSALVKQLYSPVLWSATINKIANRTLKIVECGPGKVLTSLNKRINTNIVSCSINSMDDIEKGKELCLI